MDMKSILDSTQVNWRDSPVLTVERAGAVLGLSRPSAYAAVKRGDIPTIRLGRRLLVPTARLRAMLGENEGAAAASDDASKLTAGPGHHENSNPR